MNVALSTSIKNRVSEEEWNARCELAAAYRIAHQMKWTDLIFTHFTSRIPNTDHFLINPYGILFDEITASNLVTIDHDCNIIQDITGLGVNRAGFVIHGCIHEARPEMNAVLHTHTRAGVAVSSMKCGLLPLSQHASRTYQMLSYHDYEGIALDLAERDRLSQSLGKNSRALILRNHGLLTIGKSIAEAFELMYYLDTACQIQVDSLSAGQDQLIQLSEHTTKKVFDQYETPEGHEAAVLAWTALKRRLDNLEIDYKI